jgi:peptidoglycan hydrolase-like protein with peptidoglycan-binding domain
MVGYRKEARSSTGSRRARAAVAMSAAGLLVLGLAACSGSNDDTKLAAAEANVTRAEDALSAAEAAVTEANEALCQASASYITAVDRYGDVLTQTEPTVGDVRTAGADLEAPRDEVMAAAEAAQSAQGQVVTAQQELAQAEAALAALEGTTPSEQAPEPEPEPTLPPASVERVKQAEEEFAQAQQGISDATPLREAAAEFNAAVVALEMSWMALFAESGCLTGAEEEQARAAAADYTAGLQQALADAGYYEGDVDGVYGPETVAAVQALQKANGLPQTGAMDKFTSAALQAELAAEGGAQAQADLASTAALQQTLSLAGYWDGPIDGQWTDELTDALKAFQSDLGVEPTGEVDAETVAAFEKALEQAQATPTPSPSGSGTVPSGPAGEPEASASPTS